MIFARPAAIFNLLMDLSASRARWDLTFESGEILTRTGGDSDIVRVKLRPTFANEGSRDVYLQRTWAVDPDGSFTISTTSTAAPRGARKTTRAAFGGWSVAPFSSPPSVHCVSGGNSAGNEWTNACLVTNAMKTAENNNPGWLGWIWRTAKKIARPFTKTGDDESVNKLVLAQVAGLRELCEHTSEHELRCLAVRGPTEGRISVGGGEDDECFFETRSEASEEDYAFHENETENDQMKIPPACGDTNLGSLDRGHWPPEPTHNTHDVPHRNVWCSPDGNNFRVRDVNYLRDRKKRSAGVSLADLVAVDWFVDTKRIDNLCARSGGTCSRKILNDPQLTREKFIFCLNIQVPGTRHFSIVYYFALHEPLDPESTFGRFVAGDQAYKDARLKLIPHVAVGPWVVQRAVGTKPLIVGKALKVRYHNGRTASGEFLECDIDIGSSAVANNVVRFVLGYVRTLVVDMCFLVEGKTERELPERLIGTSRVAHLEPESAVAPPPED